MKQENWEKEFDEKFGGAYAFCGCVEGDLYKLWPDAKNDLKAFISDLLTKQREEMKQLWEKDGNNWEDIAKEQYEAGRASLKAELREKSTDLTGYACEDRSTKCGCTSEGEHEIRGAFSQLFSLLDQVK